MNKTEQDLINIFHSAVPAKSSDKMEQTIEHIHSLSFTPSRIGKIEASIRLLRFISWKIWFVQGICFIFICQILLGISDLMQDISTGIIIRLIFLICGSIPFVSIPFLLRSLKYKMHETEMASYISFSMQMLIRLLSIAIGDMCMLTSGIIISVYIMHINLLASVIYWMTPFLLFNTLILLILTHVSTNKSITLYGITYLGLLILATFAPHIHDLIEKNIGSLIMVIICCVLFIILTYQIKYLIKGHHINELNLSE